ncbi:hypothetical protein KR009_001660 [Drosophila setifemur]|nr:hypothetical protein KR009_001660 [Drosophila setifemur]
MDLEARQAEIIDEKSDAGHKMASENANLSSETAATKATHELKIMDVEGAVTNDGEPAKEDAVPMVILVEDDEDEVEQEEREKDEDKDKEPDPDPEPEREEPELVDTDMEEDNAPIIEELQTSLHNPDEKPSKVALYNHHQAELENLSAKSEPSSDVESNQTYIDPMGLLERIDPRDAESQDEDDDYSMDDSSNEKTALPKKKMPRAKRWLLWMKRWPWMLHQDGDGSYAFCLYCNMNINSNNRSKHIQQHNMSLYHQERESNYVAFKKSEEQTRGADNEVKHEFGTKGYVVAMKTKRISEIEAFNNFNWLRWLRWHPWLERCQEQGTVGLCRICNVRMNVEFVYLRKRHETTKGHLEALRQQGVEKPSRKRKRSKSNPENEAEVVVDEPEQESEVDEEEGDGDPQDTTVVMMNGDADAHDDPGHFCDLIPETSPQQCRCTLCNCRMTITSFLRHCKTRAHILRIGGPKAIMPRGIWAVYEDRHPWMVADPEDPNIAYCSICRKRFMYGNSEIKRKNHENSEKHTSAVAAAKIARGEEGEEAEEEEVEETEETEPVSDPAQSEARSISDASEEDYGMTDDNWSVTQKARKGSPSKSPLEQRIAKIQPSGKYYPWLCYAKDRKTQLCKFCRVRFHNEAGKVRHEFSVRHMQRMKAIKRHQAKVQEVQSNSDAPTVEDVENEKPIKRARPQTKRFVKPIPVTMKGKVMVWKGRFPWLSYKKNEQRRNYGWCKLCEVSVFLPTSKFASKHQRSSRHIRLRFERKRTDGTASASASPAPKSSETISAAVATASVLSSGEARQKAAMAELQTKYEWLDPDPANDENHCHCRICDARLPIKLFFLRQHDSSRKHSENVERQKSNAANASFLPSVSVTSEVTADAEVQESGLEVDKESDADLSLRSDGSTAEPPAKRSRRSMEVRRILRALRESMGKRQEERSQLDMAKDMICSSFDIVSRLRTLERESAAHVESKVQAPSSLNNVRVHVQQPEPRHVMDLFFDSIAPTMKALPADLAAEGKAKIMQLVCGLEVKAMMRSSASREAVVAAPRPAAPVAAPAHATIAEPTPAAPAPCSAPTAASPSPDSSEEGFHSNVITIADDDNNMLDNNNEPETGQNAQATSGGHSKPGSLNGNHKDLPENIRRMLSNTLNTEIQLTRHTDPDAVRCVPLDKLTFHNQRSNGNGRLSTTGFTEASTSPPTELNKSNAIAMLRQMRVPSGPKMGLANNNIQQQQLQNQQIQQHLQQQIQAPLMHGLSTSNGPHMPIRAMMNHNRRP